MTSCGRVGRGRCEDRSDAAGHGNFKVRVPPGGTQMGDGGMAGDGGMGGDGGMAGDGGMGGDGGMMGGDGGM